MVNNLIICKTSGDFMSSFHSSIDTTVPRAPDLKAISSFAEFYPFYLTEHRDRTCRRLHFVGTSLALLITSGNLLWLPAGLFCGYLFAWIGHFGFEHNKPASFSRPLYSFMGDWVMYKDILTGKIKL
jgi:hypothetical protein